jgi:hypothetical protein
MDDTFKKFGNAKGSVQKSNTFSAKVHPIVEFLEFRDQMEAQINYIANDVSEHKQIVEGTLQDYFFAISKFLLKHQKSEKDVRNSR